MAFQMEVRVRAGEVVEAVTQTLSANSTGVLWQQDSTELRSTSGTIVIRQDSKSWKFVQGTLWVVQGESLVFETLYGELRGRHGSYWILEQKDRLLVRNMNADLKVTFRDGRSLVVPEGFEFWMGGIDSKGQSTFGMVQPIEMKDHLPLWNSLYIGSKENFMKEVVHLRESWGDVIETSSRLYREIVDRQIASEKEAEENARLAKLRKEEEKRRIRSLYMKKVFDY